MVATLRCSVAWVVKGETLSEATKKRRTKQPLKKQCISRIYKNFLSRLYLVFIRYYAPRSRHIRVSFLRGLGYTHLKLEKITNGRSMNSIFGNVDDLYLFCSVVEQGSLLAAAKKLELPVSTMSRRLSALEARLGLRLLEKKGRELVATETGLQAFDQLSSAMAQIESGILQLNQQSQEVEGRIRLVMPSRFYNDLVDKVVEDYIKTYPKVTIDLLLSQVNSIPETDRDLVVTFDLDGLDDMIARPLFKVEHAFFVSPEYLAQGNIETLQDLAKQDWVASTHHTSAYLSARQAGGHAQLQAAFSGQ